MIRATPQLSAGHGGRAGAVEEPSMSKLIQPSQFLRNVLKADALLSAATAVTMTLGASVLAPATGLPHTLLTIVGVALIPWVAFLLWVATRRVVPAAAVWTVIGLNLVGAVDCALVAFGVGFNPTALGVGFAAVNGLGALLLADLEYMGLRRSTPALA
jgi:hypothetical protein